MKNIHVLPTDKPSRLSDCHNNKLHLDDVRYLRNYQNIYITNDETIKEGDWILVPSTNGTDYFDWSGCIPKKAESNYAPNKFVWKIILTTDQDLIKYGVQEIPDEFLEWFVKNPCESIKIEKGWRRFDVKLGYLDRYKIIIPKEEPKQETLEEHYLSIPKPLVDVSRMKVDNHSDMKNKETLEEAMSKDGYHESDYDKIWREGVEFGVKWQSERMYSEEEMYSALQKLRLVFKSGVQKWQEDFEFDLDKWFEQFKKK
jgi:hypothetical protein